MTLPENTLRNRQRFDRAPRVGDRFTYVWNTNTEERVVTAVGTQKFLYTMGNRGEYIGEIAEFSTNALRPELKPFPTEVAVYGAGGFGDVAKILVLPDGTWKWND